MSLYTVMVIVQIAVVVIGGLAAYFTFVAKTGSRITAIETRCESCAEPLKQVGELRDELARLRADNTIFWKVIEPHLGSIIHSPTSTRRDELVDRLSSGTLSRDELAELAAMLQGAVSHKDWGSDKRLAGALLLARVRSLMEVRDRDATDK